DAGDEAETSRVRNSIAAQEFGGDYTQPFDTRGVAAAVHLGTHAGVRWTLDGGYEWQQAVDVAARPSQGAYGPTLAAFRGRGPRLALLAERPNGEWWRGTRLRARAELRVGRLDAWPRGALPADDSLAPGSYARLFASAELTRGVGRGEVALRIAGGGADAERSLAPRLLLFAGGPLSGPGYAFHQFQGRALVSQPLEWRFPVPFVAIPLGRWGRIPGEARLAPYLHAVHSARGVDGM